MGLYKSEWLELHVTFPMANLSFVDFICPTCSNFGQSLALILFAWILLKTLKA